MATWGTNSSFSVKPRAAPSSKHEGNPCSLDQNCIHFSDDHPLFMCLWGKNTPPVFGPWLWTQSIGSSPAPRCHFLWLHLGLRQRHAHHAALGGAIGRRQCGAATVLAVRRILMIQATFFIILAGFKPYQNCIFLDLLW